MKRTISILALSLLLGALLLAGVDRMSAIGAEDTIAPVTRGSVLTLAVPGMTCGSCEARIRSALKGQPGVRNVEVDLPSLSVQVVYDPATADPKALADRVSKAGYPARYLPAGTAAPAPRQPAGGCGGGCCDNRG